jgi:hypothetical protein
VDFKLTRPIPNLSDIPINFQLIEYFNINDANKTKLKINALKLKPDVVVVTFAEMCLWL